MSIEKQIEDIMKNLHNSIDVTSREIEKNGVKIGFVYLKSMTDNAIFADAIYEPISRYKNDLSFEVVKELVQANDVKEIKQGEIVQKILKGVVVILFSDSEKVLGVDILHFPSRTPSEPPTSPVIMGPREGFTEDLKTNITLLRRRLSCDQLVLQESTVGSSSQTKVAICYLDGIADTKIVKEIKKRLGQIKIDGVIDSYYLLSLLADRPDSMLKQIGCCEKPDIVAGKLLEGRVAVIVDNSPIVLTIPFVLLEDLQNSNDYYTNYIYSSFLRFIRLFGLILAVFGPGVYIALQLFHYNVLPINYLITIADSTQQIPFTPFIEILFISLLFQILYEVSLRLPSYLGLATSIVGALILGDTGVKAGLISPPTVIVVAIAKIALYTVPEQSAQITILQFAFLVLGASVGLLGIVGGAIYILAYANTIENYGAPYLAPFSPFILSDNKDGFLKVPLSDMTNRPKSFSTEKKERIDEQK